MWVSLGLVVVSAFIYAPVRHHPFVNYDDPLYVSNNPFVYRGLSWQSIKWALTTGHDSNWFPITWLSLILDGQFHGLHAGGYLLTNLFLHIANAVLLFGLLHWLTAALPQSAFVAALFALHPMHVESVAWVTERKDVLSTLFWMLTIWAYARYVRAPSLKAYLRMAFCFALGLMSKPMLVTLPFVLLLLDYWPLERISISGRSAPLDTGDAKSAWQLIAEKLPLIALTMVSSVITFLVQRGGGAVRDLDVLPLAYRVQNALVSYIRYIGGMFWPLNLAAFYPYPRSLPAAWVGGAIVALSVISIAMLWAGLRRRYLMVGWLWYLGTLIPVIGLVQVGNQAMADRYSYVPLIGLFIIIAWGVPDLLRSWQGGRVLLPATAVALLIACTALARRQVGYWSSGIALWGHAAEVTKDNVHAYLDLGFALGEAGQLDEAIQQYETAARISPDNPDVQYNLGNALLKQGKRTEAIPHYLKTLSIAPNYAQAHSNLGLALANEGRIDEAIPHYQEALRLSPNFAEAHNNLGIALAVQKKFPEAITEFSEAVRLDPGYANARNNLGHVLQEAGRLDEARRTFMEAVQRNPADQDAQRALRDLPESGGAR